MTPAFVESNMTFGPFAEGHCFRIEQSPAYRTIQYNVKIAEFLLFRPQPDQSQVFWIVEAKTKAPRPGSADFDTFIGEIQQKWINTHSLSLALRLHRHGPAFNELPLPFQTMNLHHTHFQFLLVIHEHEESWIPPLQEALQKAMIPTVKTWAMNKHPVVVVINDAEARRRHLTS